MNVPTIKALVVRSPYAQQIAAGTKPVEYRSWPTRYRGWLAIVAARRPESGGDAGRALCLVRLVDCVEAGHRDHEWLLAGPVPLARRVEVPGRLGLFELGPDLASAAWAAAGNPVVDQQRPAGARRQAREIEQFLARDDDPPGALWADPAIGLSL